MQQDVVEVPAVSGEKFLARADAAQNGQAGIRNRYTQKDQRNQNAARAGLLANPIQRKKRQDNSDQCAAGIAHKHARRRSVYSENAGASSQETRRQRNLQDASVNGGNQQEPYGNNYTGPGGQAVHSVEKIHGIYHGRDEQAGGGKIQNGRAEPFQPPAG